MQIYMYINISILIIITDNGKELLSMNNVLNHLLNTATPLVPPKMLKWANTCSDHNWQNYVGNLQGMLVTKPGMVGLDV